MNIYEKQIDELAIIDLSRCSTPPPRQENDGGISEAHYRGWWAGYRDAVCDMASGALVEKELPNGHLH